MLEFTDQPGAPWYLVEGDSKKWARVKVHRDDDRRDRGGMRATASTRRGRYAI